jgi:hypothetical protein
MASAASMPFFTTCRVKACRTGHSRMKAASLPSCKRCTCHSAAISSTSATGSGSHSSTVAAVGSGVQVALELLLLVLLPGYGPAGPSCPLLCCHEQVLVLRQLAQVG